MPEHDRPGVGEHHRPDRTSMSTAVQAPQSSAVAGCRGSTVARELAWLIHDGKRAKNHFIVANLRLVVSIAKHTSGRDAPIMGLVLDGNIELAEVSKTAVRDVSRPLSYGREPVSLDMPIGDGLGDISELFEDGDLPQPDECATRTLQANDIRFHMDALPARERSILTARFGLSGEAPLSLDQIAVVEGVTRERVRPIENRALARLRVPCLEEYLRD